MHCPAYWAVLVALATADFLPRAPKIHLHPTFLSLAQGDSPTYLSPGRQCGSQPLESVGIVLLQKACTTERNINCKQEPAIIIYRMGESERVGNQALSPLCLWIVTKKFLSRSREGLETGHLYQDFFGLFLGLHFHTEHSGKAEENACLRVCQGESGTSTRMKLRHWFVHVVPLLFLPHERKNTQGRGPCGRQGIMETMKKQKAASEKFCDSEITDLRQANMARCCQKAVHCDPRGELKRTLSAWPLLKVSRCTKIDRNAKKALRKECRNILLAGRRKMRKKQAYLLWAVSLSMCLASHSQPRLDIIRDGTPLFGRQGSWW